MKSQASLFELLHDGAVEGLNGAPKIVESVISRIFLFEKNNTVLKFYKRDNDWFNTAMRNLSQGEPRSSFIRQDFAFNQFLNPDIYRALKTARIENGSIRLVDPTQNDDELVIVMKTQDLSVVLTNTLSQQQCTPEQYYNLGRDYAARKLSIPRSFLPAITRNWYEQLQQRLNDLASWVGSEPEFPNALSEAGLARLRQAVETHRLTFESMDRDSLFVCLDGNSENLLFDGTTLGLMDAYPPKDDWRIGAFAVDIMRTAADVYGLAGKEAYEQYMAGAREIAPEHLPAALTDMYLLYGAMIMAPYFLMLSRKNTKYQTIAERYLAFTRSLVEVAD